MLGYNLNQTVYEIALEFWWFRDFEMLLIVQEWMEPVHYCCTSAQQFLLCGTEISPTDYHCSSLQKQCNLSLSQVCLKNYMCWQDSNPCGILHLALESENSTTQPGSLMMKVCKIDNQKKQKKVWPCPKGLAYCLTGRIMQMKYPSLKANECKNHQRLKMFWSRIELFYCKNIATIKILPQYSRIANRLFK